MKYYQNIEINGKPNESGLKLNNITNINNKAETTKIAGFKSDGTLTAFNVSELSDGDFALKEHIDFNNKTKSTSNGKAKIIQGTHPEGSATVQLGKTTGTFSVVDNTYTKSFLSASNTGVRFHDADIILEGVTANPYKPNIVFKRTKTENTKWTLGADAENKMNFDYNGAKIVSIGPEEVNVNRNLKVNNERVVTSPVAYSIVEISLENYRALQTKDPNTLYYIT